MEILLLILVLIFISSFSEIIILAVNHVDTENWSISIKTLFNDGKELRSGGVIGGLAGILFWNVFGQIPSFIIIIAIVIVMALSVCGATPVTVVTYIRYKMKKNAEKNADKKVEKGKCIEISTGAAMPEGAESVVMVEYAEKEDGKV